MLKKRPGVWEKIFSSHRPPIGFLGSGWEAGTRRLAPLQPSPGPHMSPSLSSQRWAGPGDAGGRRRPGKVTATSSRESRRSSHLRAPAAPGKQSLSTREKQLPSPLKLEVSVSFGGGTKCTCLFEPEGRAGRRGCILCIFHNQTRVV